MDPLKKLFKYLKNKKDKRILFLTTSNRWEGEKELPRSSMIAEEMKKRLGTKNVDLINVAKLKIFPCEGNVSTKTGNTCGLKEARLKDKEKNPNGDVRCWAAINNPTDEMYKVALAILEADIVIFFGSIRWGKMNAVYAQLVERLTWLENRHTTLGESNLLADKEAGVVAIGHNWNGENAVNMEREILGMFGFKTPKDLTFNWQWTTNKNDESKEGYLEDFGDFLEAFDFVETLKESLMKFRDWIKN